MGAIIIPDDQDFDRYFVNSSSVDLNPSFTQRQTTRLPDEHSKRQPALPAAVKQQYPADDELKVFSQPPGFDLKEITTYAYRDELVGEARIYMVDSGVDVNSPVSLQYCYWCDLGEANK